MDNIEKDLNEMLSEMMNKQIKGETPNMSEEALKKLSDLRALRNEYNQKASDIQKEIDSFILSEQNWDQYIGCYVEVGNPCDTPDVDVQYDYIKVKEIKRLYENYCRLGGPTVSIIKSTIDGDIVDYNVYYHKYDEVSICKRQTIRIIDKDEFEEKINEAKNHMVF